jgi:rubredoxin
MVKYTEKERNKIADELCNNNNLIRIENCTGYHHKFKVMTKEGYFVYVNIVSLRENKQPLKFAKGNPDTIYNINLWIKLNDKKLELVSKEYKGNDIDLKWLCKNNECISYNKEFLKPWRDIQQNHGCVNCGAIKRKETQQNKIPLKGKSLFDIYPEICDKYWDYQRNNKCPLCRRQDNQ